MLKLLFASLVLLWAASAEAAQLVACATGVTNCSNDTTNDQGLLTAIQDSNVQARVWNLWNQQCNSVYAETPSTVGHLYRVNMCLAIASKRVPADLLVSLVMSPTVVTEVLAGQGASPSYQPAGGNMVDVDVNQAIAGALTVTSEDTRTASTTLSAATTATASSGATVLTVASATGISVGMAVNGSGIPSTTSTGVFQPTTVLNVSGTSVTISQPVTAALSAAPVFFYEPADNKFSVASTTNISVGQSVSGPNVAPGTTVQAIAGSIVTVSSQLTGPLGATPLSFTLVTGIPARTW